MLFCCVFLLLFFFVCLFVLFCGPLLCIVLGPVVQSSLLVFKMLTVLVITISIC